jgi:hypothetical protein
MHGAPRTLVFARDDKPEPSLLQQAENLLLIFHDRI